MSVLRKYFNQNDGDIDLSLEQELIKGTLVISGAFLKEIPQGVQKIKYLTK